MSTNLYQARISAPEPGCPLVFAFHGACGEEHQLFELAGQLLPGAGVISPRGDVPHRAAARFFQRDAKGVDDMGDLARATEKMIAFVEAHKKAHPGHPSYAFGYSNGATMLAAVFLARPDLFERVGLLHPMVTWDLGTTPRLQGHKVLVTAGKRDPVSPAPVSEALIAALTENGADVSAQIHNGGHELRNSELTALTALFAGDTPSD